MENYSLADIRAAVDGDGNTFGSNGFLWVILIFLFFLGFSGNGGLFGRNGTGTVELTNLERDVLNGNCATQKEVIESRYTTQLGMQNLGSQMAECLTKFFKAIKNFITRLFKKNNRAVGTCM